MQFITFFVIYCILSVDHGLTRTGGFHGSPVEPCNRETRSGEDDCRSDSGRHASPVGEVVVESGDRFLFLAGEEVDVEVEGDDDARACRPSRVWVKARRTCRDSSGARSSWLGEATQD